MRKNNRLSMGLALILIFAAVVVQGCGSGTSRTETAGEERKRIERVEEAPKETVEETVEDMEEEAREQEDIEAVRAEDADSKFAVPGYKVGEIPPIEIPKLPNLLITEKPDAKITVDATKDLASVPGITITPVQLDGANMIVGSSAIQTDGSGSGQLADSNRTVQTDGEGGGQYFDENITIQTDGDGSGQYFNMKTGVTLQVSADGSGQYTDDSKGIVLQVSADGSGQYTDDSRGITLQVNGDNSAIYYLNNENADITIFNRGDGTANYRDEMRGLEIENDGKGKAKVTLGSEEIIVDAEPVEKTSGLPLLEPIPPVPSIEANGMLIRLDSGVLFDVDKYNIRPDAYDVLTKLAEVLKQAQINSLHINGHTDSDASDEHNQVLSENRANSVKEFLEEQGVAATITTTGYGESQPIATNETKEGKQQNRRVEIVIPTH